MTFEMANVAICESAFTDSFPMSRDHSVGLDAMGPNKTTLTGPPPPMDVRKKACTGGSGGNA